MALSSRQIEAQAELAARSLDKLQGLEVTRATYLGGNRAMLTLRTAGKRKFTLTVAVIEHFAGMLPEFIDERAERQGGVGPGRAERIVSASVARQYHDRLHWPVADLVAEGKPLFWNREWLETELERLGSLTAVGKANGYKASTLQNWAVEYGLVRRPRKPEAVAALVEFWRARDPSNPPTIKALAERFGVSVGWAEEAVKRADLGVEGYRAERAARRADLITKRERALAEWDRGERNVLKISTLSGLSRSATTKLLVEQRKYKPKKRGAQRGAGQRGRKAGSGGAAAQG